LLLHWRRLALRAARHGALLCGLCAVCFAVKELHAVGIDLGGVVILPALVLPLAGTQFAIDVE
jgi:hypothetical protein